MSLTQEEVEAIRKRRTGYGFKGEISYFPKALDLTEDFAALEAELAGGVFVSRLVKYFGMVGALFALPIIALGTYSLVAIGVGFAVLRVAKMAENATDYSVMNTAKQMLWLPTAREEKYKAKQAIDTFFVRAGDVLSAALVFAGTQWLALGITDFGKINVVFVLVWLSLAVALLRKYRAVTNYRAGTLGE